jgi:hypothetical protein
MNHLCKKLCLFLHVIDFCDIDDHLFFCLPLLLCSWPLILIPLGKPFPATALCSMPSSLSLSRPSCPVVECQSTPNLDVTMDAAALSIHSKVIRIFTSQTRLHRFSSLGAPFSRMWRWLCKAFRIFSYQRDYGTRATALLPIVLIHRTLIVLRQEFIYIIASSSVFC